MRRLIGYYDSIGGGGKFSGQIAPYNKKSARKNGAGLGWFGLCGRRKDVTSGVFGAQTGNKSRGGGSGPHLIERRRKRLKRGKNPKHVLSGEKKNQKEKNKKVDGNFKRGKQPGS